MDRFVTFFLCWYITILCTSHVVSSCPLLSSKYQQIRSNGSRLCSRHIYGLCPTHRFIKLEYGLTHLFFFLGLCIFFDWKRKIQKQPKSQNAAKVTFFDVLHISTSCFHYIPKWQYHIFWSPNLILTTSRVTLNVLHSFFIRIFHQNKRDLFAISIFDKLSVSLIPKHFSEISVRCYF